MIWIVFFIFLNKLLGLDCFAYFSLLNIANLVEAIKVDSRKFIE